MSRGERAGSGGRRKHSCSVTSFLCYQLVVPCVLLTQNWDSATYVLALVHREGIWGEVGHKTLQNLNIISIGRSKFRGSGGRGAGKPAVLIIISLRVLNKETSRCCASEWWSNHSLSKVVIISRHATNVLGIITTRSNQTFPIRETYIPIEMEVWIVLQRLVCNAYGFGGGVTVV